MRCLACGTEMALIEVVENKTLTVRGFEHQTFKCPQCQEIDRRFAFNKRPSIPEPDGDGS